MFGEGGDCCADEREEGSAEGGGGGGEVVLGQLGDFQEEVVGFGRWGCGF